MIILLVTCQAVIKDSSKYSKLFKNYPNAFPRATDNNAQFIRGYKHSRDQQILEPLADRVTLSMALDFHVDFAADSLQIW